MNYYLEEGNNDDIEIDSKKKLLDRAKSVIHLFSFTRYVFIY